MNEKIKELATQAHIFANQQTGDQFVALDVFKEKFAELIIQECIEQCYADYDSKEDWDKGVRWAVNQIKEHFGVE